MVLENEFMGGGKLWNAILFIRGLELWLLRGTVLG